MKIILKATLIVLALTIACTLIAEENKRNVDDYEIQRVTEQKEERKEPITKKINFVNKKTGTIIKSIDLIEDNPFSHLPFEKEMIHKSNVSFYSYPGLKLSDIYDDFSWMYSPLYEEVKDSRIWRSEARTRFFEVANYVMIKNSLVSYYDDENLLGINSNIVLFNKKGEEIFKLLNVNNGVGGIGFTDDGKYLAYEHGRQIEAYPRTFQEAPGVKIYNIETSELIYSMNMMENQSFGGMYQKKNYFSGSITIKSTNNQRIRYFIFPDEGVAYFGHLSIDIYQRIKEINANGIVLGKKTRNDIETEFFEFEKNFRKEEF